MAEASPAPGTPSRAVRIVFTLFLAGTLLFIFANSSQIGADSGLRSAQVTDLLNRVVARLGIGFTFTEGLVRKLAHFAEYMLLGFWLMLTLRVYTRNLLAFVCWPLFLGLLTAVLDEYLQKFIVGRGSSVLDVAIDFAGVVMGLCVALFIQLLVGAVRGMVRERADRQPTRRA